MKKLVLVSLLLILVFGTVSSAIALGDDDRLIKDFSFTLELGPDPQYNYQYYWKYVNNPVKKILDRKRAVVQVIKSGSSNTQCFQIAGDAGITDIFWVKEGCRYTPKYLSYTVNKSTYLKGRANTNNTKNINISGNWSPDCKKADL